jgi:signal transduction histidine kinase
MGPDLHDQHAVYFPGGATNQPGAFMASLQITAGPSHGRIFDLVPGICEIGRSDCPITLDDDTVSRRHARIVQTPTGYEVEDLESSGGTFVNGRKVKRSRLADGDQLSIGRCQLMFRGGHGKVIEEDDCITLDPISVDGFMEDAATMAWDPMRAQADLAALYRIGNAIGSILDVPELVERTLAIIVSEFRRIDFCSIHVVDEAGALRCIGQKTRDGVTAASQPTFSAALLDRVVRNQQSVLSYDAASDERFRDGDADTDRSQIRSALCVPLKNRARLVGLLQAYTLTNESRLTREDLELLTAAGQLVGTAVDNALLYDQLKREKAALQESNDRLRAAQQSLVQSEKLTAIGQLAAGIMHDIKNPMAVILGHAQSIKYMLDRGRDKEVTREMLLECFSAIEQGVTHCNAIITDLLHFARHGKLEALPTRVDDLLQGTLRFLSYELVKAKTVVDQDLPPDLPPVMVDEHQIKQVLINIIINAVQAMEHGGRLRLCSWRDGKDVCIAVTDTGCGMAEEVKIRIFDPFFTTKKQGSGMGGTGLGLSVSYGIIQSHGGSIDVQSEVGKGTTFTIRLPAAD